MVSSVSSPRPVAHTLNPSPELPRTHYRVAEVAAMTGLGETCIRMAIYSGDLRASRVGRAWLIPAPAVHDWIDGSDSDND